LVERRLGPEVRDRLVEPLLGGVYAGHADELSVHATMPQLVAAVREHGRLLPAAAALAAGTFPVPPPPARDATEAADADTAPPPPTTRAGESPPVFAGIEGGVGRLAVEVANDIARLGGIVRTDAMVRELDRTQDRWHLVVGPTRSPETIEADGVILATPASPGARLLRGVAPAASQELSHIEYASVAIVTLAVRAADVPSEVSGSGFLVPPVDGHVVKAATFSSAKWAWLSGDTFFLRASIGRHREAAVLQRDDADLVAVAMADLREAVGLRGPLVDAVVTRWGGALPQYAVGHLDRVAAIRAAVAGVPGLAVCGAAYDGVGIPAVVASAHAAATRVLAHLSAAATMEL
jgi:oxygen-dependent protoporphyrinogen oxidase